MLQGAIAGLAIGGVYAVIAVCLTLMAKLTRVINFSQAAIGMFAAFVAVNLTSKLDLPAILAGLIGVLAGVGVAVLMGFIISRWLSQANISARSAVTVAGLLFLISASYILFGNKPQPFRPVISGSAFTVGGVTISMVTVVLVGVALVVTIAAELLLRKTSVGTQLRAIADRPMAAELIGIPVRVLSLGVWAATGIVVSLVILVVAPTQTSDALTLSMLVIPSAAAALVGGFQRLDLSLIGGLALGMIQGATSQVSSLVLLKDWIPLLIIVVLLLWSQRKEVWDEAR